MDPAFYSHQLQMAVPMRVCAYAEQLGEDIPAGSAKDAAQTAGDWDILGGDLLRCSMASWRFERWENQWLFVVISCY